jgi:hypothetical protein
MLHKNRADFCLKEFQLLGRQLLGRQLLGRLGGFLSNGQLRGK